MINTEKHYLGPLCKRRHDHQGTGKSIRYIKSNRCYNCTRSAIYGYSKRLNDTLYMALQREKAMEAAQREFPNDFKHFRGI